MVKAIKRRRQTVKIFGDALEHIDEDGNVANLRTGQWVEFKCKQTPNDIANIARFAELADADDPGVIETELRNACKLLSRKIIGWNWVDLDGDYDEKEELPPLPDPDLDVLQALDIEDITDLIILYSDVSAPSKN